MHRYVWNTPRVRFISLIIKIILTFLFCRKYENLKRDVAKFNSMSQWKKKGVAIQAMKYPMDISWHTNSVMISVFKQDASVQVCLENNLARLIKKCFRSQ